MAQSVIGALRVVLGLDSANFEKGATKTRSTAKRLASAFTAVTAAGVALGAGLLAISRQAAQTIDSQAKLAQSLGTTVASVQVLQRAGDLAGVSLGQIEQASFQLTRRLSQAAAGAGPAQEALERLGLTAQELQRVPLDERLTKIQEALFATVPAAERAAVASQLFGDRAGLVFTRIDPATLRQATSEIERFGVAVSEADADQIERTNDALSSLSLIGQGLANQLAVALAPALERLVALLQDVTEKGSLLGSVLSGLASNFDVILGVAASLAALLAGKLVFSLGATVAGFIALTGPIGITVAALGAIAALAAVVVTRLGETETASYDAEAGTAALNAALGTFATTAAPSAARSAIELANANYQVAASAVDAAKAELAKRQAILEAANAEETASGRRRDQRNARGEVAAAQRELAEAEAALAAATSDRTRAARAVTGATFDLSETQGALNDSLELTSDLLDGVTDKLGGGGGGGRGAKAAVDDLKDSTKDLSSELEKTAVTAEDVTKGLASSFSSAVRGADTLLGALGKLADQLADQFLQAGFNALLQSFLPGGGAGGGFGGFLSSLIPGNAVGDSSSSGGLRLVGERGAELVNLPRGSQVFDANRTRSMLDGLGEQAAPQVTLAPRIVNVLDPSLVGEWAATPAGEQAIVNIIQRNRSALGA